MVRTLFLTSLLLVGLLPYSAHASCIQNRSGVDLLGLFDETWGSNTGWVKFPAGSTACMTGKNGYYEVARPSRVINMGRQGAIILHDCIQYASEHDLVVVTCLTHDCREEPQDGRNPLKCEVMPG